MIIVTPDQFVLDLGFRVRLSAVHYILNLLTLYTMNLVIHIIMYGYFMGSRICVCATFGCSLVTVRICMYIIRYNMK